MNAPFENPCRGPAATRTPLATARRRVERARVTLRFVMRVREVGEQTGRDVSHLVGPLTIDVLTADLALALAEYFDLGGTLIDPAHVEGRVTA